jgi:hypothetical protein
MLQLVSPKTFVKSGALEDEEFPLARRYYSGYYAQHLLLTLAVVAKRQTQL